MNCDDLLLANASNITALSCGNENQIVPSTPACIGLSALGGLLEVTSTMCLAYPEFKKKLGKTYTPCQERLMMVANLGLMLVASIAYIVGSWFGPVSLAVPTIMVSKLLCNQIIMGAILRMDSFSREQQIGVYCITCAILTLPEIGPSDQPCIDAEGLIFKPEAVVWELLLFVATIACCIGMIVLAMRKTAVSMAAPMLVYVTAQVVSAVINASVSKLFPLVEGVLLMTCLVLAVLCAVINVVSLILAAKSVDQGLFVPCTTCSTLIINMITGLIVWDDANVITEWVSYVMVHLIMLLGISLLTPADVIEKFAIKKKTQTYSQSYLVRQLSRNLAPVMTQHPTVSPQPTNVSRRHSLSRRESLDMSLASPHELVSRARAPTLSAIILQEEMEKEQRARASDTLEDHVTVRMPSASDPPVYRSRVSFEPSPIAPFVAADPAKKVKRSAPT